MAEPVAAAADRIDQRVLRVRPQGLGHRRPGAEDLVNAAKGDGDAGGNGRRRIDLRGQQGYGPRR